MSWRPLLLGALLGGLTSLPVIGLFYLGNQLFGLPFVPFDVFEWFARVLPGGVVILAIETMVKAILAVGVQDISEAGKFVEQLMGLGLLVGGGVSLGAVMAYTLSRTRRPGRQVGALAGSVIFLITLAIVVNRGLSGNPVLAVVWMGLLTVGWGMLLGGWIERAAFERTGAAETAGFDPERRTFLARLAGVSAAVAVASGGLGRLLEEQRGSTGAAQPLEQVAGVLPSGPPGRIEPAKGTRREVTSNKDFYRIDITLISPAIREDTWQLEVTGLFDRPRSFTLAELKGLPSVTEPITLSCISNPVGGELIGTAYWTGIRLADFVKELGIKPEAIALNIEAADGFHESVVKADFTDPRTLLVYGMNGTTLPIEHGFPLRVLIPNRYGMKQPKWITKIEASDKERPGFWVERGWSKEARPQIVSVVDTVAKVQIADNKVPVGGIAWAGDRGIKKVEVELDRSGKWEEAQLRTPTLGPLTWVQWIYSWPILPGRHTFRARATDWKGNLQIEEPAPVEPNGATGYHGIGETVRE